jgi:hypothetical protein
MSEQIIKKYAALELRKTEIEQAIFKLQREDAELDQKLITIKASHPELFQTVVSRPITGQTILDIHAKEEQEAERKKHGWH